MGGNPTGICKALSGDTPMFRAIRKTAEDDVSLHHPQIIPGDPHSRK